jgi:hypothetical protein
VAAVAALAVGLGGCRGGDPEASLSRPEPGPSTTVAAEEPAPAPTTTAAPTTLPPATAAACPPTPARLQPDPARPQYRVTLNIGPTGTGGGWAVAGTTEVRFRPDLDIDRIVFRLWPNGPRQRSLGARMETGPVRVDGAEAPSGLDDPTTLVVQPGRTVRAGQTVTLDLTWRLVLPVQVRDRISAETNGVRLGSFLPLLEWTPGYGWTSEPPTSQFHEAGTAPTADFDLTITAPAGYEVIASGQPDRPGHWNATAMRDVAVAVGRFAMATGTARAPDPVQVIVGVDAEVGEPPRLYLDHAIEALEDFAVRYGPYPWPTFAVSVTGTIRTGIEYPGHVLHGAGTYTDHLSHEVAHQWFYALVGNNQGVHPWLDEGLTTWAESRLDGTTGSYLSRAIPAAVRGRVAEPMPFWDQRTSVFYPGVYVQGAQALGSLGDPALVDCALRVYVAQNAHRIATPTDLVAAARAVFPDAAETLAAWGIHP